MRRQGALFFLNPDEENETVAIADPPFQTCRQFTVGGRLMYEYEVILILLSTCIQYEMEEGWTAYA